MRISFNGVINPLGKTSVATTIGKEITGQQYGVLCQCFFWLGDDIVPLEDTTRWYAVLKLLDKLL